MTEPEDESTMMFAKPLFLMTEVFLLSEAPNL